MKTVTGIILCICFAVIAAEEERPPPAELLIEDCRKEFLGICPDYTGVISCLHQMISEVDGYPDEIQKLTAELNKIKTGPRQRDVCPSLTVERTCYQDFFLTATELFEKVKDVKGFPQACKYIGGAIAKLTELREICQADMASMNATAKLMEYSQIRGDKCTGSI